ncbi:tetratricopeptide repeat protein [Dysgonomonas sp. 511]|uniref:tetratricopeptide repeat protein n=1 Tax=Dysgonomonas sp. 511 TaxID=2302930 RepID=UPI0013D009C3|nr:tetratricopeptide repeat protein [Dysgonomonas sp. 511]NDV79051.1 tetratricopeptide repeat protein [Dysgonomonas sp. 511]
MQTFRIYIYILIISSFSFVSCGLFDKEINQDQRIGAFRMQLNAAKDSVITPEEKIEVFGAILSKISEDDVIFNINKKNNLKIDGLVLLCEEYVKLDNYEKALAISDSIISTDSLAAQGYCIRGCVYQTWGDDEKALPFYNKALSLNPAYPDAYYKRGLIYQAKDELEKALADYSMAIKYKLSYPVELYNNRGDIYISRGAYDEAVQSYMEAIKLDSLNSPAYRGRAEAYYMQKKKKEALADCNQAIRLDSANILAYITRACIYTSMKMYDNAVADYRTVISLDKQNERNIKAIAESAIKDLQPYSRISILQK